MKNKTKFPRLLEKVKEVGNYLAIGVLALHIGTNINYLRNDFNSHFNSKQRKQFVSEFGFPIKGWKSDIGKNKQISKIAEVFHREKFERNFNLESLTIESDNYFKKSLFEQFRYFLNPSSGSYHPLFDEIYLKINKLNPKRIHHEIKHDKTYDILKENPEFLEQWKALAKDENGNDLYLESQWQNLNSFRETIELGFVTNYARKNFKEDIAELCAMAETSPYLFNRLLSKDSQYRNPKIIAKVKLAQENNLLPKEFTEYSSLNKNLLGILELGESKKKALEKRNKFLIKSKKFLEKYPNTIYENELRVARGNTLRKKNKLPESIIEYKKSFTAKHKNSLDYLDALVFLTNIYSSLGDKKKVQIYEEAYEKYVKRYEKGQINLSRIGVNDFLKSQGELN